GEAGEAQETIGIGGQCLRLLVGDHLQPVLDAAQEAIALGELVANLRPDPAAIGEVGERPERVRLAKIELAAAGNELLRLREEFDLADAATPHLDVVACDADLAE